MKRNHKELVLEVQDVDKSISAKIRIYTNATFSVLTLQTFISLFQFLRDKDPFLRYHHIFFITNMHSAIKMVPLTLSQVIFSTTFVYNDSICRTFYKLTGTYLSHDYDDQSI